jgi:pimeloyl-ACP methyl ester carboxylesterase
VRACLLKTMRRPIATALLACAAACALAQDYEREARIDTQTMQMLMVGEAVRLEQKNGHRFLGLFTPAANARGAVLIAHGRGWSPDYDLYGTLRTAIAEAGYSTLAIQMPVLPSTAKLGDYVDLFRDSDERLALAIELLRAKGYRRIAIVSHSLGATMTNHYLIRAPEKAVDAWVFVSIINGLEDMFRIKIPVLDVFGALDWDVTRVGADERRRQIEKISGSAQVVIANAPHFFDGKQEELTKVIVTFLDKALGAGPKP